MFHQTVDLKFFSWLWSFWAQTWGNKYIVLQANNEHRIQKRVSNLNLSRRHHCLQTLFLLFKFVTSETKESFDTRTNAHLVGTLISIGDIKVSITIVTPDYWACWEKQLLYIPGQWSLNSYTDIRIRKCTIATISMQISTLYNPKAK